MHLPSHIRHQPNVLQMNINIWASNVIDNYKNKNMFLWYDSYLDHVQS